MKNLFLILFVIASISLSAQGTGYRKKITYDSARTSVKMDTFKIDMVAWDIETLAEIQSKKDEIRKVEAMLDDKYRLLMLSIIKHNEKTAGLKEQDIVNLTIDDKKRVVIIKKK